MPLPVFGTLRSDPRAEADVERIRRGNIFQQIAGKIGRFGQQRGLPEFGVSELFGTPRAATPAAAAPAPQVTVPPVGPPSGQVQGAISGAGGGGARVAAGPETIGPTQQDVLTPTPPPGTLTDLGGQTAVGVNDQMQQHVEAVVDAFSEFQNIIRQGEDVLRGGGAAALGEIGRGSEQVLGKIGAGKEEALGTVGLRRKEARRRTKQAAGVLRKGEEKGVSEQRRIFSEISRGLQARFGGTTGTGAFATEILGRGVAGNIANIRGAALTAIQRNQEALEGVMEKLDFAETNIIREATRLEAEERARAEGLKEQARQELKRALQNINLQVAEIEPRKAQFRLEELRKTRDFIANLESQNKSFTQQLFSQAQQHLLNLDTMKQQAQQEFQLALQKKLLPRTEKPARPVFTQEEAISRGEVPARALIFKGDKDKDLAEDLDTRIDKLLGGGDG